MNKFVRSLFNSIHRETFRDKEERIYVSKWNEHDGHVFVDVETPLGSMYGLNLKQANSVLQLLAEVMMSSGKDVTEE